MDKQAELIQQMSGPIDAHLAQAGMERRILSFGFTRDGLWGSVTAQDVRSTSKAAEPGKLIAQEGRLHCFDRGGGDWWVQGEGPLRQVAFAMKGAQLAWGDAAFPYALSEPYPVRTLTCASNGREIQIPNLLAFLPLVRQMPEYKAWLKVRNIETFFLTSRSDYRFEAHFGGRVRNAAGKEDDLIMDVVLFRPDRTRLASAMLGSPESPQWWVVLYDDSGEKELGRIAWKRDSGVPEGKVIFIDGGRTNTAGERVWNENERAVIQDVIQDKELPFVMLPELEEILGKTAAKTDKPEAPVSMPVVSTNAAHVTAGNPSGSAAARVVTSLDVDAQGLLFLNLENNQTFHSPMPVKFAELTGLEQTAAVADWLRTNRIDLLVQFTNTPMGNAVWPTVHLRSVNLQGATTLDLASFVAITQSSSGLWPPSDMDSLYASGVLDQSFSTLHWALTTQTGKRFLLECSKEADGLRILFRPMPIREYFTYGPTIDRVIQSDETETNLFLNLDTGELLTPPKEIRALFREAHLKRTSWEHNSDSRASRMREWLRSGGAHLMVSDSGPGSERLEIREAVALAPHVISNGITVPFGFDQADATYLEQRIKPLLDSALAGLNRTPTIRLLHPGFDPELNARADSFCFQTRKGTVGILQILNSEDNPRGGRIRYRLLQH